MQQESLFESPAIDLYVTWAWQVIVSSSMKRLLLTVLTKLTQLTRDKCLFTIWNKKGPVYLKLLSSIWDLQRNDFSLSKNKTHIIIIIFLTDSSLHDRLKINYPYLKCSCIKEISLWIPVLHQYFEDIEWWFLTLLLCPNQMSTFLELDKSLSLIFYKSK